ncbi:putative reverse transcriptase domain-containing protein [Tanacetum coccineum]
MIGLGYESIHACVNDCFLFRGDNNKDVHFCPVCKTSRWKDSNTPGKKVPKKVLRYFSIIPRLQRLYKSSHTAKEMTWHATGKCTEPGKMQHPVDGRAWKEFDTKYPNFAKEPRNRVSFNVDIVNSLALMLRADIDFLEPLIDDLMVYGHGTGVETIDVATGQKFNMRAMVLWTINDFPAQSSLSGWSGQGYKACPTCNEDTPSVREDKDPPRKFDQDQIQAQLARLPTRVKGKHPSYGGVKIKRNVLVELNWTKRSIFYKLDTASARQTGKELKKVIWYVLHNSPEIDTYRSPVQEIRQRHVDNDPGVSATSELFALACGPTPTPISVNSCVVNGVRFVMHNRDERRTTPNSGICSPLGVPSCVVLLNGFDIRNEGRKDANVLSLKTHDPNLTKGEAFKDDQYILATQVKQCFYLEDMARRPPHWKVVEHVNHKKFSDGDKWHQRRMTHRPDIIDLDEDDDIIDDEDALPHDLADSDDEDLVNVDDDDGVDVMSADVARGHGGDGGGDDRPPSHHIPTGCGGCFANRGKGTRKANLGGSKAADYITRQETQNLGLKKITDDKGPVPIRFEWDDKKTMMPLGGHASHWSNYLGELIREMPLYYPSWQKTQFDLTPHMQSQRWADINAGIQQHLQKLYNTNKASLKAAHWVINPETGTLRDVEHQTGNVPRALPRQIGMPRLHFGMIPGTKPEPLKIAKTEQRARSFAGRDPDHLLAFEMRWMRALGSNTESGVPYTDEEINAMARKGKQRGHLPGDVEKLEKKNKYLTKQVNLMMKLFRSDDKFSQILNQYESTPGFGSGSGGCEDDEMADDEDGDKDEEDEEDGDS